MSAVVAIRPREAAPPLQRGMPVHDGMVLADEEPIWRRGKRVWLLALPISKDGVRRWIWDELRGHK